MNKFYRGLKEKYVLDTHGEGIYFATDTKEILMKGQAYIGEGKIKDVEVADSIMTIIYLDGTTKEVSLGASGVYESAIEDQTVAMTTAYGDFKVGTTVADLNGKSFSALFDGILFPTVVPTFTAPSATLKLNSYSATQEIGATAPTTSNFTTSFSAGAITLSGTKQNNRSGALNAENSFIYWGGDAANTTLPETREEPGSISYKYRAAYAEGPQPKDNKGNDYSTPLAAGTVDSSAVTVNFTCPWYASTSAATTENPVVKQSLVAWNTTVGNMSTGKFVVQPSGTLPQVFKLPRALKTLQMLNTVSNQMETIGTTDYTATEETISINGIDVTYYVYTYNGNARGEVTLLAKF